MQCTLCEYGWQVLAEGQLWGYFDLWGNEQQPARQHSCWHPGGPALPWRRARGDGDPTPRFLG